MVLKLRELPGVLHTQTEALAHTWRSWGTQFRMWLAHGSVLKAHVGFCWAASEQNFLGTSEFTLGNISAQELSRKEPSIPPQPR